MSMLSGSGKMVVLVDLKYFSMSKAPSFSVIKSGLSSLQLHYPYRLEKVYVLNAGFAFTILWNLVKPLLSKRTKSKIHLLDNKAAQVVLVEQIGTSALEVEYGGVLTQTPDPEVYFRTGYWEAWVEDHTHTEL